MNSQQEGAKTLNLREELQRKFPNTRHVISQETEDRRQRMVMPEVVKGGVTEIVGSSLSSGAGLLLSFLMEQSARSGNWLALVDGMDVFDPWSVAPSSLERLLWVRCREVKQAVKAADLLLRDGNLETVLLDLQSHSTRELFSVPSSSWHRLRMLAEKSNAALCVFTPCKTVPCAAMRLVLEERFKLTDQETSRAVLLKNVMMSAMTQSRQTANVQFVGATAAGQKKPVGVPPSGGQESVRTEDVRLSSSLVHPDRLKPGLQQRAGLQQQRRAS